MATRIRSRRTVIAAGVISLSLVAPVTPVVSENSNIGLPVAAAATDSKVFDTRYKTANAYGQKEVRVENLKLEPGDQVTARFGLTPALSPDFKFDNRDGQLYVVQNKDKVLSSGDRDFDIIFTPEGSKDGVRTTLKLTVVSDWGDALAGFNNPSRPSVDFSDGKPKNVESIKLPADAEIEVTNRSGWKVSNDNGVVRITAPDNYVGNDADVDIPVKITSINGDEKTDKILIRATKPAPENLPTWAKLLSQFLATLIGGATGRGGAGGGTGGGGGGGSSLPAGLFEGLVQITIGDIQINGNVQNNGNGNGVVHPGAVQVHGNGVIQDGAIQGNGVVQDGAIRDIVGAQPGAVEIHGNTGVEPGGIVGVQAGAFADAVGSSKKADKNSTDEGKGGKSANKIKDPRCIASLVGFGLPAAILIPVLLANIVRIPGFEGIQDAMKAAAAAAGIPLNISRQDLAAGVGGFAGAFAIAGLIGTITQCVPSAAEKAAAQSTTTAEAGTTTSEASAVVAPEPNPEPAPAEPATVPAS